MAIFSPVDNLENAVKASGKFGGVAGVLAGAHIGYCEFVWLPLQFLHAGICASLKNILSAVSKCQFVDCKQCLA